VAKIWAPIGETPIIHHPCRRDKVSVISGGFCQPTSAAPEPLLLPLLRQYCAGGSLPLPAPPAPAFAGRGESCCWDNSTTHKGQPLEEPLRRHARLHVEYFPAYAPELNPDQGVWSQSKRELANSCPKEIEELTADIIRSMNRIGESQSKLRGCIEQSELPTFLR
jgi:DDE superfamily endonuclease